MGGGSYFDGDDTEYTLWEEIQYAYNYLTSSSATALSSNVTETTDTSLKTYIALSTSASNLQNENDLLAAQLLKTNNFYLSNNRETYYQSQLIDNLNGWFKFYLFLYGVLFLFYVFLTFFLVPNSFNMIWLIIFMAFPFCTPMIGDMLFNLVMKADNSASINPNLNMKPQGPMTEPVYIT